MKKQLTILAVSLMAALAWGQSSIVKVEGGMVQGVPSATSDVTVFRGIPCLYSCQWRWRTGCRITGREYDAGSTVDGIRYMLPWRSCALPAVEREMQVLPRPPRHPCRLQAELHPRHRLSRRAAQRKAPRCFEGEVHQVKNHKVKRMSIDMKLRVLFVGVLVLAWQWHLS